MEPEVDTSPRRRFTLLDAMILVAATAVGIAPARAIFPVTDSIKLSLTGLTWWLANYALIDAFSVPLLVSWSAAVLILALRGPGGTWRERIRPPGPVACVVTLLWGLIPQTVHLLALLMRSSLQMAWFRFVAVLWVALATVAPAVAMAWITLILCDCWKPEPSWLDRFGRMIGAIWIVLFCAHWIFVF